MFPMTTHLAKHSICLSCAAMYMRLKLQQGEKITIPCPHPDCNAILGYEEFKFRADQETFTK
jgi:hypothetical protein